MICSAVPSAASAIALLLVAVVAACAPAAGSVPPPGSSPAPATTSPAPATPPPARVRLALDWTPNTNHTGFFVARDRGWYGEAGIELELLPYASATPETLLAAHQAECGISFGDTLTFAVAAGAPITSVMAILQRTASEIAVLEAGSLERPRDLDGTTYAGFGYPNEVPTLRSVIQADGGAGEFEVAVLDSAAYEALYAKRADFTITFTAWEGVEAEQRGIPLRYFRFSDYGFPEFYQVVLACDTDWLAREPEAARRFVAATVRGFEFAAEDPVAAARILVEQNPGVFDANPELPLASQRFLADGGYLADDSGRVGHQTAERWHGYAAFLFETGLLVDAAGKPLAAPLADEALFSDEFLP